jgi:hypothetical protein
LSSRCQYTLARKARLQAGLFEGIVAKRLDGPYDPRVRRFKIKNPGYSQKGEVTVQQVIAAGPRAFGRLAVEIKRLIASPRGSSRPQADLRRRYRAPDFIH